MANNPVNSSVSLNMSAGPKVKKVSTPEPWGLVKKFSSLAKLLRITAYCLRFITKLSKRCSQNNSSVRNIKILGLEFLEETTEVSNNYPSVKELSNARLFWVYLY